MQQIMFRLRGDFLRSEISQKIWAFLTKLCHQIICFSNSDFTFCFSQIWDFFWNVCATKVFFLNQIKSSRRTKWQRNIWEMQQYFLLLTYPKTIFSLLAEEITPHYHTTSVGFIKIFCNRFISHNNWQYFELVKKHSWQGSKTGDGIGMYSDQKIHLSYVERNLWTSRRRSTRLPGRKLSAYLTLNFFASWTRLFLIFLKTKN